MKQIKFKADVIMIPCYGQSLSINTSAGPSTYSYVEPLSYDVDLNNSNVQDMCAGTAEAFRLMAEHHGFELPKSLKIIGCTGGEGGICIANLSKGTQYYDNVINYVKRAKAACDEKGLSMYVPCFTWTQGEEDMRAGGDPAAYGSGIYDPFTYRDRLIKLIDDFNTDIKAITGQRDDIFCVSYQVCSHTSYRRYPRIAFEQDELARENDKIVIAKAMYDVDYVTEGTSQVHAYARSYRNMGNYYGIAAFNRLVFGHHEWLHPLSHSLDANRLTIKFNVPVKPLVLDTDTVDQLPDGNFGFGLYRISNETGTDAVIERAQTEIKSVELSGEDSVVITLSRVPEADERLTYGVNGDYWQNVNGSADGCILSGGEGEDGYHKAGAKYGPRGCLRDSFAAKNDLDGAVLRDLFNRCVLFEIRF